MDHFRFASRQEAHRQNRTHQFVLRPPFAFRRGLQIFVGHMQIAVAQVVANCELVFAHLGQHRSHRVAERVPADPDDAWFCKRQFDLSFEDGSQIERLEPFEPVRRKDKVLGSAVVALGSLFQQSLVQDRVHGQQPG